MPRISKAALAAELGITPSRVSQYVRDGLPVLANGKLDRAEALKWIAQRYPADGRERHGGANRAAELAKRDQRRPVVRTDDGNPVDSAMKLALAAVVGEAPRVAAGVARRIGLPARTAYILSQACAIELSLEAERFLNRTGVPLTIERGMTCFGRAVDVVWQAEEAEWPALAAAEGVTFDEDEWMNAVGEALEKDREARP